MYNPFEPGDIVMVANPNNTDLWSNYGYIVDKCGAEYLTIEGDSRAFPWMQFKKASDVTPNPNVDSTGAAADQGVLVITEGLLFKNLDKIQKITKTYANKAMPPLADQREAVLMQFLIEVLAGLAREA